MKLILKHWNEIPVMLPLILFAIVEQDQGFIGAAARGLGLTLI